MNVTRKHITLISQILKSHGFQKAGILGWTEGYDVYPADHNTVHVDYHVDTGRDDKDRVRKEYQIAQMRDVLFGLGYVSSHPQKIYIECPKP